MKLFLGSARTALKIILSEIKFDSNEILLLPNFICDVVLHPINDLKIKYLYYDIKENLEPDWDNLFLLITNDKNIKPDQLAQELRSEAFGILSANKINRLADYLEKSDVDFEDFKWNEYNKIKL